MVIGDCRDINETANHYLRDASSGWRGKKIETRRGLTNYQTVLPVVYSNGIVQNLLFLRLLLSIQNNKYYYYGLLPLLIDTYVRLLTSTLADYYLADTAPNDVHD